MFVGVCVGVSVFVGGGVFVFSKHVRCLIKKKKQKTKNKKKTKKKKTPFPQFNVVSEFFGRLLVVVEINIGGRGKRESVFQQM